jgi:hypothetical protein
MRHAPNLWECSGMQCTVGVSMCVSCGVCVHAWCSQGNNQGYAYEAMQVPYDSPECKKYATQGHSVLAFDERA